MESKVKTEWRTRVSAQPHVQGFSYPVFQWIHGDDPASDGEFRLGLTALSLQNIFFLRMVGGLDFRLNDLGQVRAKLRELGWSEPEHLDRIARDIPEAHDKIRAEGNNDGFYRLGERWAKIADDSSFPY